MNGSVCCHLHARNGAAAKRKASVKKRGIYCAALSLEEQEIWAQIALGQVDDELRLCRIRLLRALAAEERDGNALQLESQKQKSNRRSGRSNAGAGGEMALVDGADVDDAAGSKPDVLVDAAFARRDYAPVIERLVARIESLEHTRLSLQKQTPEAAPPAPITKIEIEVVGDNIKTTDDGAAG